MTVYAEHLSSEAQQFNWLLSQFAANTPEVIDAIAVSSDGLLIAMSHTLDLADEVFEGTGNLAYEMAVFANRAGEFITPQLIEELKVSVGF